jgi:hypothetical protein
MSLSIKALADGQLASSKGTLYTTPAATQTIVKSITLYNSGAGDNVCKIYAKPGATSRVIFKVTLAAGEHAQYVTNITLEAADLIEGEATSATEVDYTINGVQNA